VGGGGGVFSIRLQLKKFYIFFSSRQVGHNTNLTFIPTAQRFKALHCCERYGKEGWYYLSLQTVINKIISEKLKNYLKSVLYSMSGISASCNFTPTHPIHLSFSAINCQRMFESRNFSSNMPKNALFLLKYHKNCQALGAPPQTLLTPGYTPSCSPYQRACLPSLISSK